VKNFHGGRNELSIFSGLDQRATFICIQEENSTEAGLPLNAIQRRGHLISRFMPQVHNDQLVDHVSILERSRF